MAPLGAVIAVPIISGTVTPNKDKIGGVPIVWFFTWIEIVWCSLWISKVVAHYLPYIFQVFAGVVSSGVRKYSMVIRSLEIPLSIVGWAVTSLATFIPLMTKNPYNQEQCQKSQNCEQDWEDTLNKVLGAAVVGSLIWLAEKAIIQLISINYHRKQFNARIKESKHNIWLLGLLYEASRTMFPAYCNEFAEEDYIISDQLDISLMGSKHPSHHRSGSHTPMRLIQNVGRVGDKITSAFGNVAKEVTGKEVFNPNSAHSIVVEALEKNRTAEALARRIWMSFVVEGRDALLEEDVVDVLGRDRKAEAEEAFWAIDRDGNGDISLVSHTIHRNVVRRVCANPAFIVQDEMILTVTEFGRDRKAIASSMHDVDQAINVLDGLLAVVAFIIIILVFVGFLNKSFVSTLATTGTALLSLSFVFSVTAQEVLGSCIFLFVKHPYDIGDRVDIGTSGCAGQENFVVEHISLLFTVFRHVEGTQVGRLSQIPNIVLNSLWISNVSRSKAMTEQISIDISFDTSFDDLQILKNELLNFVTDKENGRDYQPTVDVDVLGTSDQSKLTLMVEIKHKSNWSNDAVRRSRRSKFMCALTSALRKVPIYPPGGGADAAGSAANPNYSVAITAGDAKEYADETAKDRENARLIPTKKVDDAKSSLSAVASSNKGAGLSPRENKAVDDLTNRDPAVDPARDDAWASNRDDSDTLGERPSIDRSDLEEVRGLLRRESTRGKRKPSNEYHPTIPTINEPAQQQPYQYQNYGQQTSTTFENQRPPISNVPPPPASYRPVMRPQATQYQSAQSQIPTAGQSMEMSQVPPAPSRSPSNPYRQRTELKPSAAVGEEDEKEDFANTRPYSGV